MWSSIFFFFTTSESCEKRIEESDELLDLDDEFQETHLLILQRFYTIFENIYKSVQDFNNFIENLTSANVRDTSPVWRYFAFVGSEVA